MWRRGRAKEFKYLLFILPIVAWAAAYVVLPRLSHYDGPFDAEPFGFDSTELPFISKTELKLLGFRLFELESRENLGPKPGTVFVLRNASGKILWTRVGAPELGLIRLEEQSARWFPPGGWVVRMKPEYTGSGELYISPFGNFRFFYHRW